MGLSNLRVVQNHSVQRTTTILIPVVRLSSNHPLSLVQAYERHLHLFPAPPSSPALLCYRALNFYTKLRTSLSLAGFKASNYSGHSFCCGGATFTFRCGAPFELISLQGDWSSDTVLLYIAQPLERPLSVAHLIAKNISSPCTWLFLSPSISPFFLLSGGLGGPHQGSGPISVSVSLLLP